VVAHELGHIVHRDFILMTMAGMLVQILYMVYVAFTRTQRSSSKDGNKLAVIGIIALIGYYIGIYLLLYLSRTREYLADGFSAERVAPRALASALVKIAYGIVAVEDTEATQSLLRSRRHLGVVDVPERALCGARRRERERQGGRGGRSHAVRRL
jgi:Zn-dependent protease with chaperone function